MAVNPGHHRIMASDGRYLTLVTQNGTVTAMPANGSNNQVWDIQPAGTRYTMRNTGYPAITYAYSTGQDGASVTGNALITEWVAIPHGGVFSIQYGNDTSKAFSVGANNQVSLSATQLANPSQQFTIA